MHELGVVIGIVQEVEKVARANGVTRIETLVLQVGELSSMIPKYIEACFPAAAQGTLLEETKLVIEIISGSGLCGTCRKVFHVLTTNNRCPGCGRPASELLSGKEFTIKEMVAGP